MVARMSFFAKKELYNFPISSFFHAFFQAKQNKSVFYDTSTIFLIKQSKILINIFIMGFLLSVKYFG